MSMDVGGSKGGLKADINVTPLVDVMLVLLIIMMLVAPMLQQGVSVTFRGPSLKVSQYPSSCTLRKPRSCTRFPTSNGTTIG